MSASDFVPDGTSLQRRSGFMFWDSFTWAAGSITQNARSPGIRPPSAKAVLVSRMALRLLPMRRNGLLEIRQRFDPRLPGLELRRQQSVGVEIRQLHAGPIHERDRRIEPEVRRRQWPDQKLARDVARHLGELLGYGLATVGELLRVTLLGLGPEDVVGDRFDCLHRVVVDFLHQPTRRGARAHVTWKQRRTASRVRLVEIADDGGGFVEHEVTVDQRGYFMARVQRDEFRLARVARRERQYLALVRKRLVFE